LTRYASTYNIYLCTNTFLSIQLKGFGKHFMPFEDRQEQRASSGQRVIRLGVSVDQSQPRASRGRPLTRDGARAYSSPDGLYVISVAARLLEMHPQTLRKYERSGLVRPSRTVGMLRLYSEEDIVRLRLIKHLVGDLGLNLAGVELSLGMFNQMLKMKSGLDQAENGDLKKYLENCLNEMFKILKTRPS